MLGLLPLSLLHLVSLALSLRLEYAKVDLTAGVVPGLFVLYVAAPLRRLLYSDLTLLVPFMVFGFLYIRERSRTIAIPARRYRG